MEEEKKGVVGSTAVDATEPTSAMPVRTAEEEAEIKQYELYGPPWATGD